MGFSYEARNRIALWKSLRHLWSDYLCLIKTYTRRMR